MLARSSVRSARSSRTSKEQLVTDGDVYVFLLQTAIIQSIVQAHAEPPRPPLLNRASAAAGLSAPRKPATEAASSSRSDWMSLGGLADMVGRSSSGKFPEKLIKRLGDRLSTIAMGRDPVYKDQSLRQTLGAFYGTYAAPTFQKQLKDNRKIEDLILTFVTTAQASIKKFGGDKSDDWMEDLILQVGQFISIIRDCLKPLYGVPKELTERLDSYATKLVPPKPLPELSTSTSGSDTVQDDSRRTSVVGAGLSTTTEAASNGTAADGLLPESLHALLEAPMVRTLQTLFNVDPEQFGKDVDFLRSTCTQQAALADLKLCVKNINLQASWPGRREDFETEEAYQAWRTAELQDLSSMMMTMCSHSPELLKSSPKMVVVPADGSVARKDPSISAAAGGRASSDGVDGITAAVGNAELHDSEEDDEALADFTYIPPAPRAYFKRALSLCLEADLDAIKLQKEDEEVSLSILSRPHLDLLSECTKRWRLGETFRIIAGLEMMRLKYEKGEVPLDCIAEALRPTHQALEAGKYSSWSLKDQEDIVRTYTSLFDSFMRFIYESFQNLQEVDPYELAPYLIMTSDLHASEMVRIDRARGNPLVDLERHVEELKDGVRILAIHEYTAKTTELFSAPVVNEVVPLVHLIDWLEKGAGRIDKRFPEPVLGSIDPVALVLEKQVPLYFDDLDSMKRQIVQHALRERDPLAFEDIFALYNRVGALLRMHSAFCPQQTLSFDISSWFEPHLDHWLANTEAKTTQWVQNAIVSDAFLPIDAEGASHSSSIDDLFGALQQPVDFILSLKWPDRYRNARFLTSLAKTISRSIEQYCHRVEDLFMEEMYPRTADGQDALQKQSAWMVKAKQTLQGEKKIEPFHFQPTSCVKLNNIEAARTLLDKIYYRMDADRQAEIAREEAPEEVSSANQKRKQDRYIFTVKVVLGENLQPIKDTSGSARIDSFVTLSDERGNKIAKTRTIYETSDPRWDEVFDIPIEQSVWLAATVWDRKLVGEHNLCGRAFLRLDPRYFGDFLAHELWLDLDTQGRLLVRVSMEGEKDDILFYFGRAFRSLKRAESDMIRIIVDKMSIFIRQCLSRSVLRTLVKTSGLNLDKALGNVKALYASALASTNANASVIPPVESEATRNKAAQKAQQLSDEEIESAIAPLFDYLDECLGTLKSSLSESGAQLVLTKVWKEVLNTVDGILLPPLSDAPSDLPQLSNKEVDIVFKWLTFLRNYFAAIDPETGEAQGVPLEDLQNAKYREILSFALWCDESTDRLMEACVREMNASVNEMMQTKMGRAPTTKKSKSVMDQRSLGTIKKRKEDKKRRMAETSNQDLLMRLLRMRPGTSDFLAQQMRTMQQMQAEVGGGSAAIGRGNGPGMRGQRGAGKRDSRPGGGALPPLPPPSGGQNRDSRQRF